MNEFHLVKIGRIRCVDMWECTHRPSGIITEGDSPNAAYAAMWDYRSKFNEWLTTNAYNSARAEIEARQAAKRHVT